MFYEIRAFLDLIIPCLRIAILSTGTLDAKPLVPSDKCTPFFAVVDLMRGRGAP
jgi:hypothetical protein